MQYFGLKYCGWSGNTNSFQGAQPSVEKIIRKSIEKFVGDKYTNFRGSSRTDAGVSAFRNCFHVDIAHLNLNQRFHELTVKKAINFYIPKNEDVVLTDCREVSLQFDACRNAKYRSYMYRLISSRNKRNVFQNNFAWHVYKLDIEAMREAASYLIGIHDYSAFRSSGCQSLSPYRHIFSISIFNKNNNMTNEGEEGRSATETHRQNFEHLLVTTHHTYVSTHH